MPSSTYSSRIFLAACLLVGISTAPASRAQQEIQSPSQDIPSNASITLTSPLDYQVFQRQTLQKGKIVISGQISVPAEKVEARMSGTSLSGPIDAKWHQISLDRSSHTFHGEISANAGGFYQLEIKLVRPHIPVNILTVPHVGIGEVFVIAGQSNSTNYGEVPQTTQTNMVVAFNGTRWVIADDPQPGVQDNSKKGSFIPSFGDALYRKYHVPIGIAAVGHGSTSVRQWLPEGAPVFVMPTMTKYVTHDASGNLISDGTLFNGMMARIHQLGVHGFRALLWHQGESDANQPPEHQITPEQYSAMLEKIIRTSRQQAGWDFPWFVAEATYHNPQDPGSTSIREAQRSLWQRGIALEGPDTDTLTADYRQNNGKGVHFNDAGLKAHGQLWADTVERYLDQR